MCNTEVQHQRNHTLHIRKSVSQFNVPTSLTPVPSPLLSFHQELIYVIYDGFDVYFKRYIES